MPVGAIDSERSAADREWFGGIVVDLLPDLYGTALRFTRNRAEAEDLVADTVARAWSHLGELANRARLRGWLFRILTNGFLSLRRTRHGVRLALVASLAMAAPMFASGQEPGDSNHAAPAKLVQLVRESTRQFVNVNAATTAGYGPFLGSVSGPDHGAMGVHFINSGLYADGELDVSRPEALIYEPRGNQMRLVGVEFLVDAQTWLANHDNTPPVLEGQVFQLVSSPNRYNIPSLFELHVWAWRDNPNGAFVDWNNQVSCEGQ
jgi:DNA-directed RNA polymerase specialized sigma24 family protein